MRILAAFISLIFASSVWGAGFNSTTLLRRTSYDIYGSQGTYSPVYELVQFDWQSRENLGGSVYLRGRTGNAYYSNDAADLLVYSAYADWKMNDNLILRGGRQTVYQDIRIFSLDGVKVDIPAFMRPNVAVSAYLGRPAVLYAADPGTNLLGFRTAIAVRENASVGIDYQAEQKSGSDLRRIGGVRASAVIGDADVGALANYDMLRSVLKNYGLNVTLPVQEKIQLKAEYNAQTPEFDPQSVFSVFNNAYQQVKRASVGVNYAWEENSEVYGWLGTIAQDLSQGFDWRVGVGKKEGLLGYDTVVDLYRTQGLDGERMDLLCSAARNFSEKTKLSGRVNYTAWGSERVFSGGANLGFKPRENVDLALDYQTVLGGFNPNSKLMASASINLGE